MDQATLFYNLIVLCKTHIDNTPTPEAEVIVFINTQLSKMEGVDTVQTLSAHSYMSIPNALGYRKTIRFSFAVTFVNTKVMIREIVFYHDPETNVLTLIEQIYMLVVEILVSQNISTTAIESRMKNVFGLDVTMRPATYIVDYPWGTGAVTVPKAISEISNAINR